MEKKKKKNNGNKVCKICNRCFANGQAMGGHMRSHLAKLPIPPKPVTTTPITDCVPLENSTASVHGNLTLSQCLLTSSSSLTIHSMKNSPIVQNFHSLNRDFTAIMANPDGNQESKYDQSYPTPKRSKRYRKFIDIEAAMASSSKTKVGDVEPKHKTSSIFDALSPAIEAARTLVMLSKDKWPKGKELIKKKQQVEEKDDDDNIDEILIPIRSQVNKFGCDMCNKVFRSYQALGGHKASHKKIIKNHHWGEDGEADKDGNKGINSDVLDDPKGFECPLCFRMFKSVQGLGGHKKAHFPNEKKFKVCFIDLNMPAPEEDIEQVSQIEFSAVSGNDY